MSEQAQIHWEGKSSSIRTQGLLFTKNNRVHSVTDPVKVQYFRDQAEFRVVSKQDVKLQMEALRRQYSDLGGQLEDLEAQESSKEAPVNLVEEEEAPAVSEAQQEEALPEEATDLDLDDLE